MTRKLSLIEEHHHPGLSSWFWQLTTFLLCHIFPLFLFEAYYQCLRPIHCHIHSKEGRSERQPNSSWEGIYQYLVMIYAPTTEICLRFHAFGKSSLLRPCFPSSNSGFLPPWSELLFQLSTVALPGRCCCHLLLLTLKWHSLMWVSMQILPVQAVSENTDSCVALAIYILPPVWLYSGHNFHFASRKFQEKVGNADNSQICIRVCLKRGRLSVAMFWGKRGVWGGKRKHQIQQLALITRMTTNPTHSGKISNLVTFVTFSFPIF